MSKKLEEELATARACERRIAELEGALRRGVVFLDGYPEEENTIDRDELLKLFRAALAASASPATAKERCNGCGIGYIVAEVERIKARADAAERERDALVGINKRQFADLAQRDRRIAELEGALREVKANRSCVCCKPCARCQITYEECDAALSASPAPDEGAVT